MSLKRFIDLQEDKPFKYYTGDNFTFNYTREDLRINKILFCTPISFLKSFTLYFQLELINFGKFTEKRMTITRLTTKADDAQAIDIIPFKMYELPVYYDVIGKNSRIGLRIRPTGYSFPGNILSFGNYQFILECEGL